MSDLRPLGEVAAEVSTFIKVEVGESFTGTFKGARKVVSPANPVDKDGNPNFVVEGVFEIGRLDKTLILGAKLIPLMKDVAIGTNVTVTKTGKEGNANLWSVAKA